MNEADVLNYVKAAAQAVNLPLTEARAVAVAAHFGRTVAIARLLDGADLAPEDELVEIYRPAPFPQEQFALSLSKGFDISSNGKTLSPNGETP